MIARDELGRRELAATLFGLAIEDDPRLFTAADELEALLGEDADRGNDHTAVMQFYYRRLEHVRTDEGRSGERLRLWDRLGGLCLAQNHRDDAVTAFEVALRLDPDNLDRRIRLADLYLETDLDANPPHATEAIVQHQAVLRGNKRRIASYEALRALYRRTQQPEKARACDDALDVIGMHIVDDKLEALFRPGGAGDPAAAATQPLGHDDWIALGTDGVDLPLSALFALVAPAFVAERTRTRPPPPHEPGAQPVPDDIARVLGRVVTLLGAAAPPASADPGQLAACTIALRPHAGGLAPVLVIGRPALDRQLDDRELAFVLARQLADLRSDRIARLLCPRAAELAQILELAIAHVADPASHSGRWLATALHAVEYAQVRALASRLRDRDPVRAALGWLAATDRVADRIGLVIAGDLASAVRVLERERATTGDGRILDLVWASVTEEVLGVRSRIERWATRPSTASDPPT
jgi:hypothetical protein